MMTLMTSLILLNYNCDGDGGDDDDYRKVLFQMDYCAGNFE
jgi:hypothetical protein